MSSLSSCLFLLVAGLAAIFPAKSARAVAVYQGAEYGGEDYRPSVCIVDGRPAVAWATGNGAVKYARASDVDGTAWGAPVTIASDWNAGKDVALQIVNGNPAVCYYQNGGGNISYVRAADASGTAWNPRVSVGAPEFPLRGFSLEVVAGNPAVSFIGRDSQKLWFVRATNANGTAWGSSLLLNAGPVKSAAMAAVDGRAAVVFKVPAGFLYTRAADEGGGQWSAPVQVAPGTGWYRPFCTLRVVNGRPAVCVQGEESGDLLYVRAADAAGSVWNAPVVLDGGSEGDFTASLAVINGRPCVAYYSDEESDLKFAAATDSDGSGWREPVTLITSDYMDQWEHSVLLEVSGRPAFFYHNVTNRSLDFTRAAAEDEGNGFRWPSFPWLRQLPWDLRRSGSVATFAARVGQSSSASFNFWNSGSGSADLHITGWHIEGADAGEFSVTGPVPATVPATVPAGGFASFTVSYNPVRGGRKNAELRLTSDAEAPRNDYRLQLSGESLANIFVERMDGTRLEHAYALRLPVTLPGAPVPVEFRVVSTGLSDLTGLSAAIDGPDSGEFSIVTPLPSSLPPGGWAVLTIRHAPLTAGPKFADLHITNNVTTTLNPYDIPLRMVPGTRDGGFNPALSGLVSSLALQPDGRILAAVVTGFPEDYRLTELHPDGSPDAAFAPVALDGAVNALGVLRNGRIVIAGDFRTVNGLSRPGLARLLPGGAVDAAFDAHTEPGFSSLVIKPDDSILAGRFSQYAPESHQPWLTGFAGDGVPVPGFAPVLNDGIMALAWQPDGKVLAGGRFSEVAGIASPFLARINGDGSRDAFNPSVAGEVYSLALRPDGEVLGGTLTGIVRLRADGGAMPNGLMQADGSVLDLALQADGKCLAAGYFRNAGGLPRRYLARFDTNGAVDVFDQDLFSLLVARKVAIQADGKVIMGGSLDAVYTNSGPVLARLNNEPAVTRLKREGTTTLRWLRSGSAPEVSDVSFELSTAAAPAWALLGFGSRIPGGWELGGLSLPVTGQVRARGRAGGSLIEEVRPLVTALEEWRFRYFETYTPAGDAGSSADPDRDGLTNLVEYAFGLSPVDRTDSQLPVFTRSGGFFTAAFNAPPGTDDIAYGAEWSPDMSAGSWTAIPDTGAGAAYQFSVSAANRERVFVRWVIKAQ